jgi:aminopeptidase N
MTAASTMSSPSPKTVRRDDYAPFPYLVDRIDLLVDLDETATRVRSRLAVRRRPGATIEPLRLDGRKLKLISLSVNDQAVPAAMLGIDDEGLTVAEVPERCVINVETEFSPKDNTELEGLYLSNGVFCTQCEAQGFRRITYFPDRPDVMARYSTTITADRSKFPVLLSNGNQVAEGDLGDGRHFARWEDPFPKPSYLFALVAGPLATLEDRFVTRSGREVRLRIFAAPADIDKCGHAMESLKKSMAWDERVYGLEYDLDDFMIVAVSDFNMGAMENKGLNVFNTKYVLANPETATDQDYINVEAVIAHEYFHNWTGNRVTCRDWFQLSLKEGLTVFRDQQFSADMGSAAVKRIADVRGLRAGQFPEDSGPMAHPVRPDSYIEINNFYTATVYVKGAEVVRMMHTLLGAEGFRKGMDLYVRRHDGQAVTCDEFVAAMQDAAGVDLGRFRLWYGQAGTPEIRFAGRYDVATRRYTLDVEQTTPPTPGQPAKQPLHIPLAVGLLDRRGNDIPLTLDGEPARNDAPITRVLDVTATSQRFVFVGVPEAPVPSLLRGFSAPVKLKTERSDDELLFLMANDSDPFARWEAGQQYAVKLIFDRMDAQRSGRTAGVPLGLIEAYRRTLADPRLDDAFKAEALSLPSHTYLGELMDEIDVDGIHDSRLALRQIVGRELAPEWQGIVDAAGGDYHFEPKAVGRRALAQTALSYLTAEDTPAARALAARRFRTADNMTDSQGALAALVDLGGAEAEAALAAFHDRWADDALVMDKWFSIQATARPADTLGRVRSLLAHKLFSYRNPNKVRALIGAFAAGNPVRFHDRSGDGYRFLADQVLRIDPDNGQIAARLMTAMTRWRRYDGTRRTLMRSQLERILAAAKLSKDTYEIVSKSLAAG